VEIGRQFAEHYAKNMNLWAWVVNGGIDLEDHVHGAGSLFFVEVALALFGRGSSCRAGAPTPGGGSCSSPCCEPGRSVVRLRR
jgi:hypothetical protein